MGHGPGRVVHPLLIGRSGRELMGRVRDAVAMSNSVPGGSPEADEFVYDEFSYLAENCQEFDLDEPVGVRVSRIEHRVSDGRELSALRWGTTSPEVVLVHGGAQNAHTWDTVCLALRPRPILAIDLPGHGRSDWREDGDYRPRQNAVDVASFMRAELAGTVLCSWACRSAA